MKIGFIGAGNMGGAILSGAFQSGFLKSDEVLIFDLNPKMIDRWKAKGVACAESNAALVRACELVVLAVKPVFLQSVIDEIKPFLEGKKIISIAAGWSVKMLQNAMQGSSAQILLRRILLRTLRLQFRFCFHSFRC